MDRENDGAYISDRVSEEFLEVNICGIEHLYNGCGSDRPAGRSDYHIVYVEKGTCNVLWNGEWHQVGEGGILLYRPHEPQRYFYGAEDYSISHYVHFSGTGCEAMLNRLGLCESGILYIGKSESYEKVSSRLAVEFAMKRQAYMDTCAAYLYRLLCIIARKYALRKMSIGKSSESRINEACQKIYENIKEPPSIATLAADACLSESRFVHLFKEVTGKCMTDFILTVRMERAKELLSMNAESVREIAERLGYTDQNYFSRVFKKCVGCSPIEFRKSTSV